VRQRVQHKFFNNLQSCSQRICDSLTAMGKVVDIIGITRRADLSTLSRTAVKMAAVLADCFPCSGCFSYVISKSYGVR
jgi:hypothetical protein